MDRPRLECRQQSGRALRLVASDLIELDIGVSLEPVLDVPSGLPVPPEDYPTRLAGQEAAPAASS